MWKAYLIQNYPCEDHMAPWHRLTCSSNACCVAACASLPAAEARALKSSDAAPSDL